jgi:hypothetical protein
MARSFCVVVLIFFISLFVSGLIFYLFASLTLLVVFIIRSGFFTPTVSSKNKDGLIRAAGSFLLGGKIVCIM